MTRIYLVTIGDTVTAFVPNLGIVQISLDISYSKVPLEKPVMIRSIGAPASHSAWNLMVRKRQIGTIREIELYNEPTHI